MKKNFYLLLTVFFSCSVVADPDKTIYCPQEMICKGTPDSCYVSLPKNADDSFMYDTHQTGVIDPNGRYVFSSAVYGKNVVGHTLNSSGNAEGYCIYHYADGTTDPHAAASISMSYENKIRMKPDLTPHDQCTRIISHICWGALFGNSYCNAAISGNTDPQLCPFVPVA